MGLSAIGKDPRWMPGSRPGSCLVKSDAGIYFNQPAGAILDYLALVAGSLCRRVSQKAPIFALWPPYPKPPRCARGRLSPGGRGAFATPSIGYGQAPSCVRTSLARCSIYGLTN